MNLDRTKPFGIIYGIYDVETPEGNVRAAFVQEERFFDPNENLIGEPEKRRGRPPKEQN